MPRQVQATIENRNEPTLGELYSTAQNLYEKTGDERLGKAIQQVEDKDGTMTDGDIGDDLNNIASEFSNGEIATTNMSDGAKHTEEEIIKQIKLNNEEIESMKNPNILKRIIMWIKEKLFDFNVEREIKQKEMENKTLIQEGQNAVKNGRIIIDENCNLQIG